MTRVKSKKQILAGWVTAVSLAVLTVGNILLFLFWNYFGIEQNTAYLISVFSIIILAISVILEKSLRYKSE